MNRLAVISGDTATFVSDGGEGAVLRLRVAQIDRDASRVLNNGMLAAQYGGHILTRERNGLLVPEQGIYRVVLEVQSPLGELAEQAWRGTVVLHGDWEAPAWRYLRNALAVIWREAGL